MQYSDQHSETIETGNHNAVTQLLQLLANGDEAQRCYSAQAVAHARITDAATHLNQCLYYPDPDVVVDAAVALAKLAAGDIPVLEDVARHHPDSEARIAALTALSHHLNGPAREPVLSILTEFVKGRANDDDWGLNSDWDDWWDLQLKAVQLLAAASSDGSLSDQAEQHKALYIEQLNDDPEPELESALYVGLAQVDPQYLIDKWPEARLMTRRKLVRALLTSQHKMATIQLFKCLGESDPELRKNAINGLCQRQATEYQLDIIRCLCDSEPGVQQAAKQGLEQLDALDKLELKQLISLAKQAPETALPNLLRLLDQHPEILEQEHLDWVETLLSSDNPDVVIAVISLLAHADGEPDVRQAALDCCLRQIQRGTLPLHYRVKLIHQLLDLPLHSEKSFPVLRSLLTDDKTDVVLRQTALEVIARDPTALSQKWLRELLLGIAAQPDVIALKELDVLTEEIAEPDTEIDAENKQAAHSNEEQAHEEQDLEDLLAQHSAQFSGSDEEGSTVQASLPNSTLAAIQQTNVEAMLASSQSEQPEEKHILDMIEDLSDDYDPFAEIVRDHFDTSDRLELNRRKIARAPQATDRQLVIRALGLCESEVAAELLIEALLGAESLELCDIFQALARMAEKHSFRSLRNAVGAAGNTLYHGDNLTKQAATRFLAYMPLSKALPLLLHGARDNNEHVRLCSLMALRQQLECLSEKKRMLRPSDKESICLVLKSNLSDPSGGVRKQALQLLAMVDLAQYLTPLLDLAIDDEETNTIADVCFVACREEVLALLAEQLPELEGHRQLLAIKLMGKLLVSQQTLVS